MADFSIFRAVQVLFGVFFIMEFFGFPGLLKKIPGISGHRVDRFLLLFGGVLLLIFGIWGGLPGFFR